MSIQTAREQVETARLLRVRALSDRLLTSMADEDIPDLAIIALVDAAVRILQHNKGMNGARACKELARIAETIGRAEAGH